MSWGGHRIIKDVIKTVGYKAFESRQLCRLSWPKRKGGGGDFIEMEKVYEHIFEEL